MKTRLLINGLLAFAGAVSAWRSIAAEAGGASAAPQASAATASIDRKPAKAGELVPRPKEEPASAPAHVKLSADDARFFESKVRPVLVNRCYECHSVEEKKAKGGLVLDSREGWQKGGNEGPAVIPGDVEKSLLVKAIAYTDPDLQMPPKGKLKDDEIAALKEWVQRGAPDPRIAVSAGESKLTGMTDAARSHWAYQPVKKPDVPAVKETAWAKTPVDNFILAKLEENGMKPSVEAAKEALIRRATYDLTGLPPTPGEVLAFVKDTSPNAFEKVVDRLLASPRYGERWGRYWLDTARYSDTSGQENNNLRSDYRYPYAWTYRDYVIKSFNDDKPYDKFLKEQIAADLLPESKEDPSVLAALGFITVGKRFAMPNDTIDERIDTLTKATMSLTVSCARCHDHKFDPIPTADYYSLHGIFGSTTEPAEKPIIGAKPKGKDYEDYKAKLAEWEAKNKDIYYNIVERAGAEFRKKASAYLLVAVYGRAAVREGGQREALQERNRLIAEHKLDRDIFQGGLRNIRPDDAIFAPLARFAQVPKNQFEERAPSILREIKTGRMPQRREINSLVVEAFKQVSPESIKSIKDVTDVYGALFEEIDGKALEYVGKCRTAKGSVDGYGEALVELFSFPSPILPASYLSTDRLKELAPRLPVQNNGAYRQFHFAEINELELTHPGAPARAMAVEDAINPRNSPILVRGEAQNRGPSVPRQFLEVLSGPDRKPFTKGSGRLELAEAIATPKNPLTARAMINRIWMHHFGEGLVRTPDDLGVQSEKPSHPELLEYLASRFVEDGWSIKKMHKLIMLSSAYQQSSDTNPEYAEKDPDNRLLWRANLRRLDFEAIRDTMLMFTGKMDKTVGGKPVNLTEEPYSNRRSVYGYIDRGQLPELMAQFDFSDPDMANSKRTATIVPQQALFFMNSPMAVDVARKVTSRPEFATAKDEREKVRYLYLTLFQRTPRQNEVKLALDFVQDSKADDLRDPSDRGMVEKNPTARPGQARRPVPQNNNARRNDRQAIKNQGELVERKPLTAWEQLAQALLFTNEMAYVN